MKIVNAKKSFSKRMRDEERRVKLRVGKLESHSPETLDTCVDKPWKV